MSETTASSAESHDPLKAVADAMEAAVQAARDGASEARSTLSEAAPAAGQMLSSVVYKACYGISYGVVFPSVLIARTIPKNNPAVLGFIDGARAAVDMVSEMKGGPAVGSGGSASHPVLDPDAGP